MVLRDLLRSLQHLAVQVEKFHLILPVVAIMLRPHSILTFQERGYQAIYINKVIIQHIKDRGVSTHQIYGVGANLDTVK